MPATYASNLTAQLPVAFEHVLLSSTEEGSAGDVSYEQISEANRESIRLARSLIQSGATVLLDLLEIQSKGWKDESISRHFSKQRETADNASEQVNMAWSWRTKKLLEEIDHGVRCIPRREVNFLDLGCSPGGFSSYVLAQNHLSTGCGISLPVADGGHEFCLENPLRSRYTLFSANMTYYALAPAAIGNPRFFPLPAEVASRNFDIVLLDGHQLRTQTGSLPWDRDRLLISQIIIAMQAIKVGGTIIMKLSLPHKVIPAKIAYMFKTISGNIQRWKPRTMHANRGTFYLVARRVGSVDQGERNRDMFSHALRQLWSELTFGGENRAGRFMVPRDLDFAVTTDELVENNVGWLVKFGIPLWEVQKMSLRKLVGKV
ncbi:hypothetical protein CPC08DRAFT_668740 [Agrocybe pediades]|nr:hypothetical protein CPC08DRAFT_668740 [Agrocybe pediades]